MNYGSNSPHHTERSAAVACEDSSCGGGFTLLPWRGFVERDSSLRAQNDGYGTPPFSVILNGGCRSEESLTTSPVSVRKSFSEAQSVRSYFRGEKLAGTRILLYWLTIIAWALGRNACI
jgi:hypothetical protein